MLPPIFLYLGLYNVAATAPHTRVGEWMLSTMQRHSVKARAEGLEAPVLTSNSMVMKGATAYQKMCVVCHGAPGVPPSEIGKGITPRPPDLQQAVKRWNETELYWIVKNGIKLAGMPAFGPTHRDEDLWAVVAFIRRLPRISPDEYRAMAHGQSQPMPGRMPMGPRPPSAKDVLEGKVSDPGKTPQSSSGGRPAGEHKKH